MHKCQTVHPVLIMLAFSLAHLNKGVQAPPRELWISFFEMMVILVCLFYPSHLTCRQNITEVSDSNFI